MEQPEKPMMQLEEQMAMEVGEPQEICHHHRIHHHRIREELEEGKCRDDKGKSRN
jgi:hypothetical protein